MGYTAESIINPTVRSVEIELLSQGISYPEIAQITGGKLKSIAERNRHVYKIDVYTAFRQRIEKEGFPCRLSVSDSFGYWFAGLFDGEGSLTLFTRSRATNDGRYDIRIYASLALRDDDENVIKRILNDLDIGHASRLSKQGNSHPQVRWACDKIDDLVEVLIPCFENYPLYSKKAREFAIWKNVAVERYFLTLGGKSNPYGSAREFQAIVAKARDKIADIRRYFPREQ